MPAVRRFVAWPFWGLVALSAFLVAAQTRTSQPVLILLGLVMMAGVVLLADPWRVAGLVLAVMVLGLVGPLVDEPLPGYWARYAWLPVFGVFAFWLAMVERRRVRAVRHSGELLRTMVDATDQPVFAKRFASTPEQGGTFELTNEAWSRVIGVEHGSVDGRLDLDVFPPEMLQGYRPAERQVLATGEPVTLEQVVGPVDDRRTYLTTLFPIPDEDGVHTGVGGIATDVTDRKRAEEQLAAVFARSPVPTLRLVSGGDRRTVVLDCNDACRALLGRDVVGLGSQQLAALLHRDDVDEVFGLADRVVAETREHGRPVDEPGAPVREVRLVDGSAQVRWAMLSVSAVGAPDSGGNQELIVQFEDITARKQAEDALTERALTDSVTGLPNRYALSDRLGTALARLGRHPGMVCVLFCDLDRFKQVNDAFGHATGDLLLQEVARRLSGAVRPEDTVGRQGGDEFVVVCEGLSDPRDAVLLASRLQDRLRERWSVGGHDFDPTTSIGIAFTDDPACDPGDLLRQADVAMYRAKDSGRDRIELYDRSLDDELASALAMQQRLRDALADDGLVVHYQPVVRLDDRSVVGAEALVRMRAADGSLLGPDSFLPHAEAGGLIHAVGRRVLDTALADVVAWRASGLCLDVGINASPTELARPDLVRELLAAVQRHGADPSWLVLEVTETALVHESSVVSATLQRLHSAGVRIALDDFGTGYSSLSWLHQFPVDIVKIDKSFVQTMADDQRRAVVVRAVVDIADETGLHVIAEGVETERQARMLTELGCETAQGWLFGRPVPVDDPSWAALPRAART